MKSAEEWSKLHGEVGLDREDIGIRLQWIRAIQADALRWAVRIGPGRADAEAERLERGQEQEMK